MLAAVRSATLIGVDGQPVTVEVHVSSGPARVPGRRAPRRRGARVARARPRRGAVVGAAVAPEPHHRQPRARRRAQDRLGARARGRARRARRQRRAARRRARRRRGARRARARRLGAPGAGHARARRRARARAASDAVIVPLANASEAELVGDVRVRAARTLGELRACLKGEEPWPDWDPPVAPSRRRRPRRCSTTSWSTSPTCAGCRSPARRSRSRPRAATTCCSAAHRAPARRCWPGGSRTILPPLVARRGARGHPHPLRRRRCRRRPARRAGGRSARRTTPRPRPRSSAAAAAAPDRARSRSRTGGSSSSTSSASSRPPRSTRCANRSRSGRCASRAKAVSLTFPAAFQLVACSNPCPCGSARQRVPLQRRAARAVPASAERAAPRPLRPARARRRARVRTTCAGESSAEVARAGRGRVRATTGALRRLALVAERARRRRRGAAAAPARTRRRRRVARAHRRPRTSPDAAPPASVGWRARSPTSTTAPASPPRTSSRRGHAGRRAVSRARPSTSHLDPIEVAAATLASLPDMTHRRLRALVERGGGPVGALAGLERGLAPAVLCDGAPADELPARQSLARVVAGGGAQRPHRAHAGGTTHARVRRRAAGLPARRGAARNAPRCCWPRATRPEALDRPRVAVVGTRAATPNGLDDARELGATLARAGVTVVSGLAIGIDGAVHEGALDAGGTVIGVVGDRARRRVPAPPPHAVRPRARVGSDRERARRTAPSRASTRSRCATGSSPGWPQVTVVVEATLEGRRTHHRRPRARVRAHGDGVPRVTAQPGVGRHQPAHLRRRHRRARSRPTCCSSSGSADPDARCRPARAATRATRPRCWRRATANRPRSTSWRAAAGSRRRGSSPRCARSNATAGWSGPAACAGRSDRDHSLAADSPVPTRQ